MLRIVLVSAAALVLAGCVSTQNRFASNCAGYGFQAGTAAYAQCMQNETHAYRAQNADFWRQQSERQQRAHAAQMQAIQNNRPVYQAPVIPAPPPIRQTHCVPVGGTLSCTTY